MARRAPLPGTFMITAIVGFLITAYLVKDLSWKFTLLLVFAVMFIASYVSMTRGPVVVEKKKKK